MCDRIRWIRGRKSRLNSASVQTEIGIDVIGWVWSFKSFCDTVANNIVVKRV